METRYIGSTVHLSSGQATTLAICCSNGNLTLVIDVIAEVTAQLRQGHIIQELSQPRVPDAHGDHRPTVRN